MPARQTIEENYAASTKTTGLGILPSGSGKAARRYLKPPGA
ncbi:MAG: hypothetical protein R3F11_27050 [Verrucomicrobiales bacterium]